MILQLTKYDMQVLNVVQTEFKPIASAKKQEDGTWTVYSWFGLYNNKRRLVWSDNLDIPKPVITAGEQIEAGPVLQADLDVVNAWLTSIGAPEIQIQLNQTSQILSTEEV